MKIFCPRPILLKFRRECRARFPLEHMAALYGRRSDEGNVIITEIVPIATGTKDSISIHKSVIDKSKRAALRRQEDWLGTIHSHCSSPGDYCCWHLSSSDIKSAMSWGETICGVVHVDEGGKRSSVHWYVPAPLPQVYYDEKSLARVTS